MSVVHVRNDELVIDDAGEGDYVGLLRNEFLPLCSLWLSCINSNDATSRRVQGGLDVEDGAAVADDVIVGVGVIQQADERAFTVDLAIIDAVFRGRAVGDMEDEVGAIVGDKGKKRKFFGIGSFVNQLIFGLRCAGRMPVDAVVVVFIFYGYGSRLREAVIKESLV